MKAGRELDALVAEKVFGAPPPGDKGRIGEKGYWTAGDKEFVHTRPWSTDIAAAWEVVERLKNGIANGYPKGHPIRIAYGGDASGWHVEWSHEDYWPESPFGETAPHAICLAALRAVGALS